MKTYMLLLVVFIFHYAKGQELSYKFYSDRVKIDKSYIIQVDTNILYQELGNDEMSFEFIQKNDSIILSFNFQGLKTILFKDTKDQLDECYSNRNLDVAWSSDTILINENDSRVRFSNFNQIQMRNIDSIVYFPFSFGLSKRIPVCSKIERISGEENLSLILSNINIEKINLSDKWQFLNKYHFDSYRQEEFCDNIKNGLSSPFR